MTTAGLEISVASASASAPTELAAFDSCLIATGVANHNLLYLSSIIPPGATVVRQIPQFGSESFGNRLFCVIAQARTSVPGHEAWAGIAWVQDEQSWKGLFAEAHGSSGDEVRYQLTATLEAMMKARPGCTWGDLSIVVEGTRCTGQPVCSLAVAAYRSVPWD